VSPADPFISRADARLVERALALGVVRGRALDVGCGDGSRVIAIASRCPEMAIVGVEPSADAVSVAHARAAEAGFARRVRLLRGDPKRLPLRSADFDLVLCDGVLHRLEAILPALNEVSRVSRPGAAILLRDALRPPALSLRGILARFTPARSGVACAPSTGPASTPLSLADAERLVQRSRLRGIRVVVESGTHLVIERRAAAPHSLE